jgi:hypothetical protein
MMIPWMRLNFTEDDEINNFIGSNEVFHWTRVSTGWWNWLDFGDPEWLHMSGEVACDPVPELRDIGIQTSPVMMDGPILACEDVDVMMRRISSDNDRVTEAKEEERVTTVERGETVRLDGEAGRVNRAGPVYNRVRGLVEACFADSSDSVSVLTCFSINDNVDVFNFIAILIYLEEWYGWIVAMQEI